jgi:hypothetical protein
MPADALPVFAASPLAAASAALTEPALSFDPVLPLWVLLALGLFLAAGVRWAYTRTTRNLTLSRRLVLGGLRAGAILLLLLCMARPALTRQGRLEEKGVCFIAVDSSSSMNFRDADGGLSRWEAAARIIATQKPVLQNLEERMELQRFLFDAAVRPATALPGEDNAPPQTPAGSATDLAALLDKLAAEAAGASTSGAVLISDGRHNAPKDLIPAALALGRAGVPLHVIGIGRESTPKDFKDIRIRQMSVPEKAFVGGRMMIGLEIESTLPAPQNVPLVVEVNGKKIFQKTIELRAGAAIPLPILEAPCTPDALGVHRVVATIGCVPDENNLANNTATGFFRVFRGKIGVWYIEGAIRKEFGAIRSALETAPNLALKAMNAFTSHTSEDADLLPASPEEWAQCRLIIIGDMPAKRFGPQALLQLAKFVENGGAVLFIGGFNAFGAGGWQDTPLADVLPVELSADDGMQSGPLPITVMPDGAAHSILKIDDSPEKCAALWRKLPPLPGVNKIRRAKPAAHVLLRAGQNDLLVAQDYGKGRSAVFTGDMTWQWIIKAGQPEAHKAFWRNLVTWLTRSDYRETDKTVFADADRLHYQTGEEALFGVHAQANESSAERLKNARIIISLARMESAGESLLFSEDIGMGPGDYTRRFAPGSPGSYRFTASAVAPDGTVIDKDSLDLQVTAPDLENDNPQANLKLLRRIAALSGGGYFDPPQAHQAFDLLRRAATGCSKSITQTEDLWNNWLMLLAFISALSLEWGLRKKWGLV